MIRAAELTGKRLRYREGEYSLTFDDGPVPGVTIELARLLQKEGIAATFFVLGERCNDEALRELKACGQQIGNHTYSHQNLTQFTGDHEIEIPYQIGKCHECIQQFTGARIPFRAPGGAWRPPFTKIANKLPYAGRYVGRYGWDVDPTDWRLHRKQGNADKIEFAEFCRRFELALDTCGSGIVLLHDGFPQNEAAVADPSENQAVNVAEFVIAAIRRRGRRIVPLKEPSAWF